MISPVGLELSGQLFVYGTLKPGGKGYRQFFGEQAIPACPAMTRGRLYDLPAGYPAMTVGDDWVQGYVLGLMDTLLLARLDDYEDYDPSRAAPENLYYRTQIEAFTRPTPQTSPQSLGLVWGYLMRPEIASAMGGRYLASGLWDCV
jgi:gamma-glutamylcyclotransferase (GGCT)/AIG2-like uncharacterized protein YtfP